MKHISLLTLLFLLWNSFTVTSAQSLQLPAPFSDGMVLQRNQPLTIKGKTEAGTAVKVKLDKQTQSTTADAQGNFTVTLAPLPAGGPYELTFETPQISRTFHNVWMGEVWLCSGQSNMEMRLRDIATAQQDLKMAEKMPRVHLYNMESAFPVYAQIWEEDRMKAIDQGNFIRPAQWKVCTPEEATRFSAIGFHFARLLADSLGCHVGIISNAVGGSTTEGWIDSTSLSTTVPEMLQGDWRKNPNIMKWARDRADYNLQKDKQRKHTHPYAPGYLYYAAIRPIAGYPLRGVLWYQGESNADLVQMHERLFPLLEKSWRSTWNKSDLPFYFVQLSSISTRPIWPEFRNSQRLLADSLPQTYMTVSSDVGDSLDVHPKNKRIVGQRLAHAALHHTYGNTQLVPCGPQPVKATYTKVGEVRIEFTHAQGLRFAGVPDPAFFEVAGKNGVFVPARQIKIEGNNLIIRSNRITHPVQIRYGWKPFTRASLINRAGFPCSTFRLEVEN